MRTLTPCSRSTAGSRGKTKVVSCKLVSRARSCISASVRPRASRKTARGLPSRRLDEKTSIWTKRNCRVLLIGARSCAGEDPAKVAAAKPEALSWRNERRLGLIGRKTPCHNLGRGLCSAHFRHQAYLSGGRSVVTPPGRIRALPFRQSRSVNQKPGNEDPGVRHHQVGP